MANFSTLFLVASNGGRVFYYLLFYMVEACVLSFELWKRIMVWFFNFHILIITRWVYSVPELRISLEDIGLFKAYTVKVKWKDEIILIADEILLGLEGKLMNLRNMSFILHVKNLLKKEDTVEALFTFNLYWRILPSPTTTGLEHNQELRDEVKPKVTRLLATDGRIILRPSRDACLSRSSPKIVFKVKAGEAVFTKGANVFIVNGRANKMTGCLKGRVHDHGSKRKKDNLINMACFRIKLVFPKESPDQLSFRLHGTRVRITRSNLKDVLWSVNEFKSILNESSAVGYGDKQPKESTSSVTSHNNKQISKAKINIEDFVISLGTNNIPEIAAIKVSLDITADNWIGKSRYNGLLGVQGVSVNDVHAVDPCIILGNDLITASWRCSFTGTHVYKRCMIVSAESNEILSLILRPDFLGVFTNLKQDYSLITQNTGPASLTQFGETIKLIIKEHCPRTQISTTLGGVNLYLEMDVFEQLAACTLEDIRVQCTQDAENLSCDFTVKDIEVEDRINNVLSVRMLSKDGIHKRSFHATIIQEATNERRSVSFQQLYGEMVDLNISLEEELLLKLLVFFGITEKEQLWGEEKKENTKIVPGQLPTTESQSSLKERVSFFFERLEVNSVSVAISISPNQDLPEDLFKLKEQLGIPNGLPPCMENARLDFERFLRTGIYYRSFDGLVRDVRRHYFKEIGRQSAKILGSLHLLGNVTGLKDNIAEGLTELKETGDYFGFARHVRSGLTDSYYKLTDSWSVYVKPTPSKSTAKPVEERIDKPSNQDNNAGLLGSLTSGLGEWIFSQPNETTGLSQAEAKTTIESVTPEHNSPMLCNTPQCDVSSDVCQQCNRQQRDVSSDVIVHEGDNQSTDDSMSTFTAPSEWELMPRELQKKLKGQEFLRRLKESIQNDEATDERFLCCLKLRFADPNNKLNALITTRKVYFMKVGAPSRENVVLDVDLARLYKTQEKNHDGKDYLEIIMRMDGMQRLCLPSPNAEDNPLVRCDSLQLAAKAANKIYKAKRRYSNECCPCKVILNTVVGR